MSMRGRANRMGVAAISLMHASTVRTLHHSLLLRNNTTSIIVITIPAGQVLPTWASTSRQHNNCKCGGQHDGFLDLYISPRQRRVLITTVPVRDLHTYGVVAYDGGGTAAVGGNMRNGRDGDSNGGGGTECGDTAEGDTGGEGGQAAPPDGASVSGVAGDASASRAAGAGEGKAMARRLRPRVKSCCTWPSQIGQPSLSVPV